MGAVTGLLYISERRGASPRPVTARAHNWETFLSNLYTEMYHYTSNFHVTSRVQEMRPCDYSSLC